MRILHIDTGWIWRGGQQQVFLLHRELLKNGVDSRLLARADGELIVRCRQAGLPVAPIISPRPWNPMAIWRVWRAARKIDIIHAHDSHSAGLAAIAKSLRPRIKFVCHRRVSYPLGTNPLSSKKYKAADGWIAVSEEVADSMSNVSGASVKVIHSALDVEAFRKSSLQTSARDLKASFEISEKAQVVGLCGAFSPQKGHEVLVRAAKNIAADRNIIFLLVGDGPTQADIKQRVRDAGLEKVFRFTGFRKEVAQLTSLFTVAVVPSIDGEGSSASIKEAMAIGVPVVVSDLKGNLEVIGDAGLSFPNRDHGALAENLAQLLDNELLRLELSDKGRARAEMFRPEITASATIDFYREILK